jgi:hypothetical protein
MPLAGSAALALDAIATLTVKTRTTASNEIGERQIVFMEFSPSE